MTAGRESVGGQGADANLPWPVLAPTVDHGRGPDVAVGAGDPTKVGVTDAGAVRNRGNLRRGATGRDAADGRVAHVDAMPVPPIAARGELLRRLARGFVAEPLVVPVRDELVFAQFFGLDVVGRGTSACCVFSLRPTCPPATAAPSPPRRRPCPSQEKADSHPAQKPAHYPRAGDLAREAPRLDPLVQPLTKARRKDQPVDGRPRQQALEFCAAPLRPAGATRPHSRASIGGATPPTLRRPRRVAAKTPIRETSAQIEPRYVGQSTSHTTTQQRRGLGPHQSD
jgi:hypothetical protein